LLAEFDVNVEFDRFEVLKVAVVDEPEVVSVPTRFEDPVLFNNLLVTFKL
jgi:hypothetical protein